MCNIIPSYVLLGVLLSLWAHISIKSLNRCRLNLKTRFLEGTAATGNIYPQVVACVSVSCSAKFSYKNNIDRLRQLIYDTATHLSVSNKDSSKCKYSVCVCVCVCVYVVCTCTFLSQ